MKRTYLLAALVAVLAPAAPAAAQTTNPTTTQPVAPAGQATQPGIRAVDPTTVKMTLYTVSPADMLASRLIGLDVHNLRNEEIGEIGDLIVDEGKTIRGIVVNVGGFLGIGERNVAVQPGSLVVTREGENNLKAVLNTTKEELEKAREFKYEGNFARR
jgi:sporulation protein YlmC with PRC-barrel domain